MEETLGKRIAAHRRRLGLTQDRLAELLGVTAQAVSKWENDQSCPDITMLPKLAEIFSCTTDTLLGIEKTPVHQGELVEAPPPEPGETGENHFSLEVEAHPGRKTNILIAVWVLLTGCLLLTPYASHTDLWSLLWRTGLMIFGIGGLWPHFSFFRLACALFGGYFLINELRVFPDIFNRDTGWMLPAFLLLFGLHLLVDAFRKSGKGRHGHIVHPTSFFLENRCNMDGEAFDCSTSFGENHHRITLPRLNGGSAQVSFGSLSIDLGGCEEIEENCAIDLNCAFGKLELFIPRIYQAVPDSGSAFGNIEIIGSPVPNPKAIIAVECSVSFGQIVLHYV